MPTSRTPSGPPNSAPPQLAATPGRRRWTGALPTPSPLARRRRGPRPPSPAGYRRGRPVRRTGQPPQQEHRSAHRARQDQASRVQTTPGSPRRTPPWSSWSHSSLGGGPTMAAHRLAKNPAASMLVDVAHRLRVDLADQPRARRSWSRLSSSSGHRPDLRCSACRRVHRVAVTDPWLSQYVGTVTALMPERPRALARSAALPAAQPAALVRSRRRRTVQPVAQAASARRPHQAMLRTSPGPGTEPACHRPPTVLADPSGKRTRPDELSRDDAATSHHATSTLDACQAARPLPCSRPG